jgi:hypothetical protein
MILVAIPFSNSAVAVKRAVVSRRPKFGPKRQMRKMRNSGRLTRMLDTLNESSGAPDTEQPKSEETDRRESEALQKPKEIGGPKGAEPTRFGDWERGGRCIDF